MNTLKVALAIALSTVGVGSGVAFGVASLTPENETKVVEAANNVTVYLDKADCSKIKQSGTTYCYYYGGSSSSADWPGNAMSSSNNLFSISIPSDTTTVIFSVNGWGGDCQTENLSFDSSKTLWTLSTNYTNGTSQKAFSTVYQKTVYVLDKENTPLSVNQKAHVWRNGGTSAGTTSWPGNTMTRVGGASSHIYSTTVLGNIDRIIFHNNQGNQTGDLSIDGVCSVLETDWDGTTWISLEAAQFIDNYMHFYDISTSNKGQTANCSSNYQNAKAAYNSLSSNDIRKEVLDVKDVSDRLAAWAEANGDSLNSSGAVLGSRQLFPISKKENCALLVVVLISIISSMLAIFLILKKRKHQ